MRAQSFTEHAQKRKQQRGISDLQVELIRTFGDDHYQKGGCSLSFISAKKLTQLRHALDKLSNVALVKAPSEDVVTIMHMERSINRTRYAA
jgi:hypothetical protein